MADLAECLLELVDSIGVRSVEISTIEKNEKKEKKMQKKTAKKKKMKTKAK